METIIGIILKVSGHTFDIIYDLYFTEERLIAVLVQHPSEAANNQLILSWQTILWGTALGRRKENLDAKRLIEDRRLKNKSMTPCQLAESHPGNYVSNYESVASVEIKTGWLETRLKITHTDLNRKERSFGLTRKQAAEARNLLQMVLPSKLKAK